MKRFVIIVAGGKGKRMGSELPKQFIPLCGKPILMHTLMLFHQWDATAKLIMVLPESQISYWRMLCREIGCNIPHEIAEGGETRFHSVRNGLSKVEQILREEQIPISETLIAIHDGVRPFADIDVIENCFRCAQEKGTAIPVMPAVESLRMGDWENSRPVDRSRYFSVQTPQVFRGDLLIPSYQQEYTDSFTDDASVVEHAGNFIHTVKGNDENIKITTPIDLLIAEALITRKNQND